MRRRGSGSSCLEVRGHFDAVSARRVEVAIGIQPPGTSITVSADYDKAMQRFGRLTSAEGHGLGLPLVAAIAELHKGKLTLGDAAQGLRVTITLPIVSTST